MDTFLNYLSNVIYSFLNEICLFIWIIYVQCGLILDVLHTFNIHLFYFICGLTMYNTIISIYEFIIYLSVNIILKTKNSLRFQKQIAQIYTSVIFLLVFRDTCENVSNKLYKYYNCTFYLCLYTITT